MSVHFCDGVELKGNALQIENGAVFGRSVHDDGDTYQSIHSLL